MMVANSTVAPVPPKDAALRAKVAQQFEALFVAQLLKGAHAAKLADDPLAGDPAFRDFQDDARAQALAAAAPLGVARALAAGR